MLAGEYCSRDVIIVGMTDTVMQAAKLMRQHHVGDVLVVSLSDGKRIPISILTDRDIVVDVLAKYKNFNDFIIQDIVTNKLITVYEKDDLMIAIKKMRLYGVRRIPVVNSIGELVGILSVEDILDVITEQLMDIGQLFSNETNNEIKLTSIKSA